MKFYYLQSPNYNPKKRAKNKIKFLVFHYTGMQSEVVALKRLCSKRSKVSCHYFVGKSGNVIKIVPEEFTAWHAGKSCWKNYKNINPNSIGIELSNPGHYLGYKKFSKKQINSLIKLSKKIISKYKIIGSNIVGHSDIAPMRKKDPGEKFPWKILARHKIGIWHKLKESKLKKNRIKKTSFYEEKLFYKYIKAIGYENYINMRKKIHRNKLIKAFQRRYRTEKISGIIDQECLLIAKNLHFLAKKRS
tara:strand:- start:164 stop:904 length:741 start_codon:yes stop_codon:yes gene_type:complete